MPRIEKISTAVDTVSTESAPQLIAGASKNQAVVVKGKKSPTKAATESAERTETAARKLKRSSSEFVQPEEEQGRTHRRHQPARAAKTITNRILVMTADEETSEKPTRKTKKQKTAEAVVTEPELAALPAETSPSQTITAQTIDEGKEAVNVAPQSSEETQPETQTGSKTDPILLTSDSEELTKTAVEQTEQAPQIPVSVEKLPEAHRACCTKRSVALVASAVVLVAAAAAFRLWSCPEDLLAMKMWC